MKNKHDTIKLLNDLRRDLMLEYQSNPLLYNNPPYPKIEALDQAINALYVLGQVTWERDVAIQQLDELGYGLAERTNDKYKRVSRITDRQIRRSIVFLAKLMLRIVATGKLIRLSDVDYLKLVRLKDTDFSAFD